MPEGADSTAGAEPIVAVRHLSVSFGPVQVLWDVGFNVQAGEMLGMVGHNGSGKSTIVKVLAGYHAPMHGSEVSLRGRRLSLPLEPDAQFDLGFALVHQDLALAHEASVWENVGFGHYTTTRFQTISVRREQQKTRRYLRAVGASCDPGARVADLSLPEQARVALARGLRHLDESKQPVLLVLDESTNFFGRHEARHLLRRVKAHAEELGFGALIIGHHIDEIVESCDRVLVLRNGRLVADLPRGRYDEATLVGLMISDEGGVGEDQGTAPTRRNGVARAGAVSLVGATATISSPAAAVPSASAGDARSGGQVGRSARLRLDQIEIRPELPPFSLEVAPGEVVGLTGLPGAGWEEVVQIVGGDRRSRRGRILIDERCVEAARWHAFQARRLGVGYVPAGQTRAAAFASSAAENLWLGSFSQFTSGGFLRWGRAVDAARRRMHELQVVPPEPTRALGTFSGGNRQKLIVGRWVGSCGLLCLEEPTQGVDVHARAQLIERLRRMAAGGMAILVGSQDTRDLAVLCDRVLVMREGAVTSELSGAAITPDELAELCYA